MNVDVVVVGGGPAGCSTALALRAKGHSVTVISALRQDEKPTETAVPALAQILKTLGASEALNACEPCFGIDSSWGRNAVAFQPSIINPFGHAWFIHRARFDHHMKHAARRMGVHWVEATALSIGFHELGVSVLTTSIAVRGRWLVVATGSPLWLPSVTQQKALQIDSLVAFWTQFPQTLTERLLFVEPSDYGWWYMCPADGTGTIACFVTDAPNAHELGVSRTEVFNQLFRATPLFGRFPSTPSAELVYPISTGVTVLPRTQGDRWVAVGDAAVKLDPLGSCGTMTALDSGNRAALGISAALQGNTAEIDRYSRWSAALVREFIRQRGSHYAIEGTRRASGFWVRRAEKAT